jgi:hypothetical protein
MLKAVEKDILFGQTNGASDAAARGNRLGELGDY